MNNSCQPIENDACHWVGLDVAKGSFDAALLRPGQRFPQTPLREVPVDSFARTPQGVHAFIDWIRAQRVEPDTVRVVMEATGKYSTELAAWLREQVAALAPAIANPRHTSAFIKSMGVRNKTDRLEARALAFFGMERRPNAYEPHSPERSELRELSRHRDGLVRERTMVKNRIHETSASTYVNTDRKRHLAQLIKRIQRVEAAMKKCVAQSPTLKQDVALLTSIYGVAFINATTILAELGELRRFEKARQLTAFAGMSPRHHESGTSVKGCSRLCKQGNSRSRQSLYLSAMVAIRGDNPLRCFYQNLLQEGKPKMVALAAVMRKLLVLMRSILISGHPYDPLWKTCAP